MQLNLFVCFFKQAENDNDIDISNNKRDKSYKV